MPQLGDDDYYITYYNKNDIYWGLGLECETYIKSSKNIIRTGKEIKNNLKCDRYSVDYLSNFNKEILLKILDKEFDNDKVYYLPELLNSHSLTKLDKYGEHNTIYSKDTPPNPKFSGRTVFEEWIEFDPKIREMNTKNFLFDGDTIEFRTRNFYKVTVNDILEEYNMNKEYLLNSFNNFVKKQGIWKDKVPFSIPEIYPGFAIMASNPKNNVFFNNGSYHLNITLPTKLDDDAKILEMDTFIDKHHFCIKTLQWIYPFLIVGYGSPDFLSLIGNYSKGSLRLAMSRYIGVGTYNPDKMIPGKQMQISPDDVICDKKNWWQDKIKKSLDYKYPDTIGYDINFSKHYQHGIEIRIFDAFPSKYISDLFSIIILLFEKTCSNLIDYDIPIASNSPVWNNIMTKLFTIGSNSPITKIERKKISQIFNYSSKKFHNCSTIFDYGQKLFTLMFTENVNGYLPKLMYPNLKLEYIDISQWNLAYNYRIFYQILQKNYSQSGQYMI